MNELNPFKLVEMLEELENTVELHSISVRYKGEKVVEGAWAPFSMEEPQMMHSLSKIGTSICVGFAVDEGKLRLEDKFLDYVREIFRINMIKPWKILPYMIFLPCRPVPRNAVIMYGFPDWKKTGRKTGLDSLS